ncbi:hypothetical protein GCM10010359_05970 [Streptomyces morookaense]|nr:hypothetical protein GCM10010359_05970 [Streptomyces morookaense]
MEPPTTLGERARACQSNGTACRPVPAMGRWAHAQPDGRMGAHPVTNRREDRLAEAADVISDHPIALQLRRPAASGSPAVV